MAKLVLGNDPFAALPPSPQAVVNKPKATRDKTKPAPKIAAPAPKAPGRQASKSKPTPPPKKTPSATTEAALPLAAAPSSELPASSIPFCNPSLPLPSPRGSLLDLLWPLRASAGVKLATPGGVCILLRTPWPWAWSAEICAPLIEKLSNRRVRALWPETLPAGERCLSRLLLADPLSADQALRALENGDILLVPQRAGVYADSDHALAIKLATDAKAPLLIARLHRLTAATPKKTKLLPPPPSRLELAFAP